MHNNRIYVLALIPVAALYAALYAAFALSNLHSSFVPEPNVAFGPYVMPKLEAILLSVRAASGVVLLLAMFVSLKRNINLIVIAFWCLIIINSYNFYIIMFFMNDARALGVSVVLMFHPFFWIEYLLDVVALALIVVLIFKRSWLQE